MRGVCLFPSGKIFHGLRYVYKGSFVGGNTKAQTPLLTNQWYKSAEIILMEVVKSTLPELSCGQHPVRVLNQEQILTQVTMTTDIAGQAGLIHLNFPQIVIDICKNVIPGNKHWFRHGGIYVKALSNLSWE